ncbi:MAG TPA: amidohydrolase, partial [Blastocatellia bacterium]
MRRKFYSLVLILLCAAITLPAVGAQGRSDSIVIRNARIFTVTKGVIENGSIVITGGKITAVGANVSAPGGARVIDARGLSVYPGMIDSGTTIGLSEVGQGAPGTVDTSEIGDNNANIHVEVAVNPESTHIGVTRVNGITTVLTMPRGGLIAGQSA